MARAPNFYFWEPKFSLGSSLVFIGRFITYFTVIQTETYIFRISTFPKSICDKTTAKSVDLSPKSLFWTWKQLFTIAFLLATSNVWPLAIPEFFAHNMGIRLLANHSLYSRVSVNNYEKRTPGPVVLCL